MLTSFRERALTWLSGNRRTLLRVLLFLFLVVPAVAYIGYQTWKNWDQLVSYRWSIRPGLWALSFLAFTAALGCTLVAWSRLVGRLGVGVRFRTNARIYCLADLSKRLPGFIWYMASRVLLYQGEGVAASIPLAGSALEMALMATTGVLTYFLTLPFTGAAFSGGLRLLVAGAVLLVSAILLQPAVFNRLVGFFLRRLGSQMQVRIAYRDILPLIPVYLLAWALIGVTLYLISCAVYPLPLEVVPTMIATWAASGTLTMLISSFLFGFGTREVTLSVFLAAMMPQPIAVVVALIFSLSLLVGELIWTGIFALWR